MMVGPEPFFAPLAVFFSVIGILLGVVGLAATIYAFYDLLFQRPEMEDLEKLIWIIVILVFNIVGVLAYFVFVMYLDENPVAEAVSSQKERRRMDELERLAELRDRDVLTDEEFEEEKRRILGDE